MNDNNQVYLQIEAEYDREVHRICNMFSLTSVLSEQQLSMLVEMLKLLSVSYSLISYVIKELNDTLLLTGEKVDLKVIDINLAICKAKYRTRKELHLYETDS